MTDEKKPVYEFGPFRVVSSEGLLTRNGRVIRLAPKSFELLLFLVENRGRVLDKEILLTKVWPGTFVEESNLTKNISLLRRCLGERKDGRPYIETFPRRGYRFDAHVREAPTAQPHQAVSVLPVAACHPELGTFVGRDQELRKLETFMEETARGAGKIALLSGEAGIGKTALAESFLAAIRRRYPDVLIARGVCIEQYGAGEAYLPFLDVLSALLATCARERALAALRTHAPAWCLHLSASLSSTERDRIQYETIGATKERMLREMSDFLGAFTAGGPLVLLLEDLHWADTSSADLLRSLAHRIAAQRLMVVGTYRPEDVEISKHPLRKYVREMLSRRLCEEIPLPALRGAEITDYFNARFAPNDFPSQMVALIARKTEGHPLFLSGLADFLVERGDIACPDGLWTATRALDELALEVPRSVGSIIRNRLERLDENDRRALEYASIEGEEFTSTMISVLAEAETIAVEEQLDQIDKVHGLIRKLREDELPEGSLAIRYRFSHALYQNALYDGVVPGRRTWLHRRAGVELLRMHAGQESQVAAQLATHFERGREFSRAVEYLLQMGDNACRLYDNTAALQHYSHALEISEKLSQPDRDRKKLLAYQKRGTAQLALGQLPKAEEDFRCSLERARALGDASAECAALNGLANSLIPSHKLTDLAAAAAEAMGIAESLGSQPLQAEAMTNLGLFSLASGHLQDAENLLGKAIPSARGCDHAPALIPGLTFRGLLHNFRSEYQQAEAVEIEAAALASKARDGFHLPLSLFYLGIIQANLAQFSKALATLTNGLEMANRNGNRVVVSRIPNAIGWIYRELRDIPKAIEHDRLSAETAREMKLAEAEAHALMNLAHDYAMAGEMDLAAASLRDAEPLLESDPWYRWRFFEIRLRAASAEVCLAQNELDPAHQHAECLLSNAVKHDSPKYVVMARNLLAQIAMAAGEYERAARELRTGLADLREHSAPLVEWKCWAALGRALEHAGDHQSAQHALAQSQVILKTIAGNIKDLSLRDTFLNAPDVRAVFAGIGRPQGRPITRDASELRRRAVKEPRSPRA
jgi:DNA-binding winged helix-turn-helix (wHTH) protein/tetratricopeptide (TPR) repeat protein